jgi:copper chaperone CopZ
MEENNSCCCQPAPKKESTGFLSGLLYGLLPHTFCIAFILFTVLGVTVAAGVVRSVLLVPYFFQLLVGFTIVMATISAAFYLRRNGMLSVAGARRKWRYLSVLYGTTIGINILLFTMIFPALANAPAVAAPATVREVSAAAAPAQSQAVEASASATASTTLAVDIPCSGHAPLISGELNSVPGVQKVTYRAPDLFDVTYDPGQTSLDQIVALDVFQAYPATIKSP